MENPKLSEKYIQILSSYRLPLIIGFLGLMFLVYGLISFLGSKESGDPITISSVEGEATDVPQIVVDIAGAVVAPGVYRLADGARLQDALIAAGGFSADADRERISREFNLAAKLTDGGKIYVPGIGEGIKSIKGTISIKGEEGLININTASLKELDSLPGVGSVTAEKIVSGRPYTLVEDLQSKKIVSASVYEKIKDKITAY